MVGDSSPEKTAWHKAVKAESHRQGTARWYKVAMIVVATVLLLIFNVGYTTWVDSKRAQTERESDQRWCQLLTTLDEAYSTTPPTSELGRKVAVAIHDLRTTLDC